MTPGQRRGHSLDLTPSIAAAAGRQLQQALRLLQRVCDALLRVAVRHVGAPGSFAQRALSRSRGPFAPRFLGWFSSEGSAVPFGRSLTYRFAQGAFWGALAFAGVQALPWPILKGLSHASSAMVAATPDLERRAGRSRSDMGTICPGMSEAYNSAGSPSGFQVLSAVGASRHTPVLDLRASRSAGYAGSHTRFTGRPRRISYRSVDRSSCSTAARTDAQSGTVSAKYGKFAYSSYFAFNVPRQPALCDRGVRQHAGILDGRRLFLRPRSVRCRRDLRRGGSSRAGSPWRRSASRRWSWLFHRGTFVFIASRS